MCFLLRIERVEVIIDVEVLVNTNGGINELFLPLLCDLAECKCGIEEMRPKG